MDKRAENNRIVKESLCEALVCLMKSKPFQDITITELITKAGVARATYYRNFSSKEDVAREHLANIVAEFSKHNFNKEVNGYDRIMSSWKCIDDHKDILILYSNAGLHDLLIDNLSDLAFYNVKREDYKYMDNLYFTAFIGALHGVVRKWLIDGAKVPYQEMAKNFIAMWNNKVVYKK